MILLLCSAATCGIPCFIADCLTGTAFFQQKRDTMSAMSDLHLTAAMSLAYGRAIEAGHDDVEAMAISRDPYEALETFGITFDEISLYADFLIQDYDWSDYDDEMPAAVASSIGLLFDADTSMTPWSAVDDTNPPF